LGRSRERIHFTFKSVVSNYPPVPPFPPSELESRFLSLKDIKLPSAAPVFKCFVGVCFPPILFPPTFKISTGTRAFIILVEALSELSHLSLASGILDQFLQIYRIGKGQPIKHVIYAGKYSRINHLLHLHGIAYNNQTDWSTLAGINP
jgi:hypothetical protein